MHSAPWTKTSSSMGLSRHSSAISLRDSSRASTTRLTPRRAASRTPESVWMLICVLACSGTSGMVRRSVSSTPQSCTNMASTPDSPATRAVEARARSSRSLTSVFSVR